MPLSPSFQIELYDVYQDKDPKRSRLDKIWERVNTLST